MANNPKDRWDKALIVAQICGTLMTPVIVAIVGAYIAYTLSAATKERELSAQEMTQALDVLQSDPDSNLRG